MDLQKESFIKPAESYPHWLKIILWKKLGRLVQKYRIAIKLIKKNIKINISFPKNELRTAVSKPSYTIIKIKRMTFFSQRMSFKKEKYLNLNNFNNKNAIAKTSHLVT